MRFVYFAMTRSARKMMLGEGPTCLKRRGMSISLGYTDSQAEISVLMPFREENVPACFVHSFGITVSGN